MGADRRVCIKVLEIFYFYNFGPKRAEKNSKKKKKSGKNFEMFFPNFFSIEIIVRECRLRTQNDRRSSRLLRL